MKNLWMLPVVRRFLLLALLLSHLVPKSHASETDESGQPIIRLPDIFVDLDFNGVTGSLEVVNITCTELKVTDFSLSWDITAVDDGSSRLDLSAGLNEYGMDCYADYGYYSLINGTGSAIISVSDSSLDTSLTFTNPGTDEELAEVTKCTAVLEVTAIEFLQPEILEDFFLDFVGGSDVTSVLGTSFCELLMDPEELKALLGDDSISTTLGDVSKVDPLEAERALVVPETVDLVELQGSETWPGWGVAAIVNWAGKNLGKEFTRENEDGVDVVDLLINQLVGDFLYTDDEEEALTLNLTNAIRFEGVGVFGLPSVLLLDQVSVVGLDTFSSFDNFQVLGNHTVQMDLTIEMVQLRVSGDLLLGPEVVERVDVDFSLPDVNATVAVLVAVDEVALGAIPMSAFLDDDTDVALNCLLASVLTVELADSAVHSLRILEHDSLSLQRIIGMGIEFGVGNVVADILPNLLESSNETTTTCDPKPFVTSTADAGPFIDFRDLLLEPDQALAFGGVGSQPYGGALASLKSYLTDELLVEDAETGELRINGDLIAPLTEGASGIEGTLEINGTVFTLENSFEGINVNSDFTVVLKNLRLEALNSFENPTAIADPLRNEAFVLDNKVTMRSLRLNGDVSVSLSTGELGDFQVSDMKFGLDVDSVAVLLDFLAVLYEENFLQYPLGDLFDLDCWLSTVPASVDGMDRTLSILDLMASVAGFTMSASCVGCEDMPFDPISDEFRSVNKQIDELLSPLRGQNSSLQDQVDRMLVNAPKKCRHHLDYDPEFVAENAAVLDLSQSEANNEELSLLSVVVIALASSLLVLGVAFYFGSGFVASRHHRAWLHSLAPRRVAAICVQQAQQKKTDALIDSMSGPMFCGNAVPELVRWLVPCLLLVSTALFAVGFFTYAIGASIYLKFAGENMSVEQFKSSLGTTSVDMWRQGGQFLAVLSFIGGLLLPMFKNIFTLLLWFLPTSILSTPKRLFHVRTLNELGKFDIAIVFILLFMVAAYKINIESDIVSVRGRRLYEIDVVLHPTFGLYLWAAGQFLSQVSGRMFVYYHQVSVSSSRIRIRDTDPTETLSTSEGHSNGSEDKSCCPKKLSTIASNVLTERESDLTSASAAPRNEPELDPRTVLNEEVFSRSYHSERPDTFEVRSGVNALVALLGVVSIGLMVAGSIMPAVSYETSGLFADMNDVYRMEYGVISLAQKVLGDASNLDDGKTIFGLWLVAIVLVLTVMVTPILCVCGLLTQWFYPLRKQSRSKIAYATGCFHAWQYTETFFISAVAVAFTFQLSDFSSATVGRICEGLGAIISIAVDAGILEGQDLNCYIVTGSVEIGSLLLLLASFCTALLHFFVTSAAKQAKCAERTLPPLHLSEPAGPTSSFTDEDKLAKLEQIASPPAVFSDRFRWCMRPVTTGWAAEIHC